MVPAEGSARAAAPIGVDVEAVMNGLRANDRVGFCRSARARMCQRPRPGSGGRGSFRGHTFRAGAEVARLQVTPPTAMPECAMC